MGDDCWLAEHVAGVRTAVTAPFVTDPDFTLYVGDVGDVLAGLPDASVDRCVTSPPYWGLRDYGVEGQIGLEATPELYVTRIVDVFRQVHRVLADHGTLWINLGDSYAANRTYQVSQTPNPNHDFGSSNASTVPDGLKAKDLVGIPWRVAFALQADGWYLRSDIIWSKPNPMPESVTDRPTKAHEYVFLLSKGPRYFFDQEAVREKYGDARMGQSYPNGAPERQESKGNPNRNDGGHTSSARGPDGRRATHVNGGDGSIQHRDGERWPNGGRNIRSVWEIATAPYAEAHFATFPPALVEPCVKAGCPEWVCGTCGKPRERIVERTTTKHGEAYADRMERVGASIEPLHQPNRAAAQVPTRYNLSTSAAETVGWSDCGHGNYQPGTVLDPFMGSGTTAHVARRLGRRSIGIELNPEYAQLAARRLQQLSLLTEEAV